MQTEMISYQKALHDSMWAAMRSKPSTILMGQGVSDVTSIFGTTRGLKEEFPDRVIDTPISEEGMAGVAVGAALNGAYVIQTHIRVDFLLLAMNQIVNMAAKYKYMYGGRMSSPMLIRACVGRSWGQGPQHSQSLQALFAHIPGLKVIMPVTAQDVLQSYAYAVNEYRGPVLSIEHRLLYDLVFPAAPQASAPFASRIAQAGDDVTIVATSYMVPEAQKAQMWLRENGSNLSCEIISLQDVSNVDHDLILTSVRKTGRLVVADTSWIPYGVCSEVSRGILERDPSVLKAPVQNLGMAHVPCPTSHGLEDLFYPGMDSIVDAVYRTVSGKNHGRELPTREYVKRLAAAFKGPF
jgi:pyruvate/2-oxoglutarate/acetoin dehydrogenase E1 component